MIHDPYFPPDSKTPFLMVHDPYFPPAGETPVAPSEAPICTIPDGTCLPERTVELVKHCFMIFDSELVEPVADEINFPGRAIPRLIRSKLATICSDIDRYHWRAYASRLDYAAITITAYGTPK